MYYKTIYIGHSTKSKSTHALNKRKFLFNLYVNSCNLRYCTDEILHWPILVNLICLFQSSSEQRNSKTHFLLDSRVHQIRNDEIDSALFMLLHYKEVVAAIIWRIYIRRQPGFKSRSSWPKRVRRRLFKSLLFSYRSEKSNGST